jgi:hypothetical protein
MRSSNDGKLEDYENKFALISLEVERLNGNLKMKVQQAAEQEQQLTALRKDNARLKEAISEANYKSTQSIAEINEQMRRQLYQKDEEISRLRASDAKASELHIEWQKLNQILKLKQEEIKEKDGQLYRLQG